MQDKCNRDIQIWWTEKYGMINKGDKAVSVVCSRTVICRTYSVKRYKSNYKFCSKKTTTQNEFFKYI